VACVGAEGRLSRPVSRPPSIARLTLHKPEGQAKDRPELEKTIAGASGLWVPDRWTAMASGDVGIPGWISTMRISEIGSRMGRVPIRPKLLLELSACSFYCKDGFPAARQRIAP
jgi:hypothetical protein